MENLRLDAYQIAASCAVIFYNMGIYAQWRKLEECEFVHGISLFQWVGATIATAVFVIFYIHLGQYAMAALSIAGGFMCARISWLTVRKSQTHGL